MIIALAWAFKDDSHVQEMATWQKRLSKGEFLKLSKSQRERYLKLYPHSSYRFLMHKGDPDNVEDGQKTKAVAPVGRDRFMSEDQIQEKRKKRAEHINTRKEIAEFNKANTAVINPASLQALDHVTDSHLREAADNITKNKQDIVKTVGKEAKRLPNMYGRGLAATRDLVSGKEHPDDLSTTQKHAMHRVLGGIATMALLGAGVMACGMAAAPLGVLMGVTLFNMWAGSKHGKNLRDDINELKAAREKKRRDERKALGTENFDDDDSKSQSAAGRLHKDYKAGKFNVSDVDRKRHKSLLKRHEAGEALTKEELDFINTISARDNMTRMYKDAQRKAREKREQQGDLAVASDSVFDFEAEPEMSDEDTIGLIVDHVTDLLKYHSVRDFQEHRDEMFAGASETVNNFQDLKYLLRFANCDDFRQCGNGMAFSCAGGVPSLEKMFRRMGYFVSATENDGQVAYHYDNGKGRATLGSIDDGYYIHFDGDFDYRTVL